VHDDATGNVWVALRELARDLDGRIVWIGDAEQELELRVVLLEETFEVCFEIRVTAAEGLQHGHRGQRRVALTQAPPSEKQDRD
jgi:hypothetical protein